MRLSDPLRIHIVACDGFFSFSSPSEVDARNSSQRSRLIAARNQRARSLQRCQGPLPGRTSEDAGKQCRHFRARERSSDPRTIGTYRQDHPCAPAAVSDTAGAIGRVDYERQSTWSVGMNFWRQLQTVTKKKKKPSQATIRILSGCDSRILASRRRSQG